ncbi:angiopoietin-related protein 7-like isoform X2 [Aquila chrysaetos chrysaetos]|uniref:angiopoietin-related protein 7-like isoform X2 n=1 Tax=Aquila chrysaetos chrysaetos TaxID=223781 RepID=UPI0005D05DEB|nr:angiopoietin-related protein 7-like isoform X2 [Aquila chrysaetos chrysaetos]
MARRVGSSPGTVLTRLMEVCPGTGSARAGLLSLILAATLCSLSVQKSLPAAYRDHEGPQEGTGLIQCGEYSNQVLPNGRCKIVATLPQGDEQRCPDMFRCTDEVSYWLHENEERKQQVLELRELISELQEELRNHRHRIKVLELQHEEAAGRNHSLAQRVQDLEHRYSEASTLQHIQATLLYDMQAQINNISVLTDWAWRNPTCLGPAEMRLQEEMHHPEVKHARNCPIDCASVYYNGLRRSGVYSIMPSVGGMPIEVLCEMDTEGGGWTVIQRRQDGSVDFNRTWNEYKEGFGDLNGEFWLGNENIHKLTSQGDYSLRIDLEDWNNKHKHAFYQVFSIEDEANYYRLHVDGFSGTVEDSFAWYHNKRSFSTPDSGNICAEISHGGWWYHQCFFSNLNGVYYKGGRYSIKNRKILGPDGIVWYSWKDTDYYSLRKVVMMIRPRTFRPHLSP